MDSTTTALLILVIVQSAMLGILLRLYLHARQLHEQARREAAAAAQPASEAVVPTDQEARHRWESLDTSRLHELNREEVEKLLAKVRGTGVKSLTAGERAFLDRMAQAIRS